jgi:DNA-binding CsgD family transcriptional regulator
VLFIRFHAVEKKNVSRTYLKPQMSTEFSHLNDNEDPSLRLSKREIEVLRLICQERTNQEMAAALFVSVKTIEGHRERIRYKTNTKNIAGMVLYAIKHGIFEV